MDSCQWSTCKASQVVLVVKNLPASAGDIRDQASIPGLGRSPGGGCGNWFHCSYLGNPMDSGSSLAHTNPLSSPYSSSIDFLSQGKSSWGRGVILLKCSGRDESQKQVQWRPGLCSRRRETLWSTCLGQQSKFIAYPPYWATGNCTQSR